MVTLTKDISELRSKKGVFRSSIANETGIEYHKLVRLEQGKPIEVTEGQAQKLAKVLGVQPDVLEADKEALAALELPADINIDRLLGTGTPSPNNHGTPSPSIDAQKQPDALIVAEHAFRAGCHAMLRRIGRQRSMSDRQRMIVRELVATEVRAYALASNLGHDFIVM